MFNSLGSLNYEVTKEKKCLDLKYINEGINKFDKYFIICENKSYKIFDRICDHAGGQLIHNKRTNKITCPIHSWEFDPKKGRYLNNTLQKKTEIPFKIKDNKINFFINSREPNIIKINENNNQKIKIRFFNHAFVLISTNDFKFATDPWAFGPAFNNGWWLKNPTKNDWNEELDDCDFIYISHNHPDHLHALTLSKINKSKTIIIPSFISDSTCKLLKEQNFKKIIKLDFNKQYRYKNSDLIISILKSGDFREDSGIYFSINKFTALFDVDSNNINFLNLPKNTTLYASSFAGGTSGYPIMFENFSSKEKRLIINKNKNFILSRNIENIKKISPKYFMPYAGFFEEKLNRDKNIKKINLKNKIEDYEIKCKNLETKILNLNKYDSFIFNNEKLVSRNNIKKPLFKDIDKNFYLKNIKTNYKDIDIKFIEEYFCKSKFKDKLVLYISLTNDNFSNSIFSFSVDFTKKIDFNLCDKINNKQIEELYLINNKSKYLFLKIRKESFLNTIYNKLPWEDILIGFQCKIYRIPNIYNADFWHHFTNVYISSSHVRLLSKCNNCNVFKQKIDNELLISNPLKYNKNK